MSTKAKRDGSDVGLESKVPLTGPTLIRQVASLCRVRTACLSAGSLFLALFLPSMVGLVSRRLLLRARAYSRRACTSGLLAARRVSRIPSAAARAASMAFNLPASILLLTISIALPVMTFAAAFSVSNKHAAETQIWVRKGYFLSAAIDLPPAANFGSLGLTITLAAFMAVAIVRHHIVAERLHAPRCDGSHVERNPSLVLLHAVSLASALTAAVGGHGVAAYQHCESGFLHNLFAACFVLFALLHFALESTLERLAGLSSRLARASRLTLVLLAAAGCATFICHVLIEEMHRTYIGIGKLVAACAEIMTCLCFLIYLATYSRSFHETRITLSVQYIPTVDKPTGKRGIGGASDGFRTCADPSELPGGHFRSVNQIRRSRSAGQLCRDAACPCVRDPAGRTPCRTQSHV